MTAERDGRLVDEKRLPGRQGPVALVYLALERARPVPIDELADAVWGEELPRAWEAALSAIVSKVRTALSEVGLDARRSITTVSGRYQLTLPANTWVDVEAARVALDEAEGRVRASRFRDAWGPGNVAASITNRVLLAGVDAEWAERARQTLRSVRVRALSCLASAALAEHGVAARGAVRAHATGAVPRDGLAAAPAGTRGCGQSRGGAAGVCGVSRAAREGTGRDAVAGNGGSVSV